MLKTTVPLLLFGLWKNSLYRGTFGTRHVTSDFALTVETTQGPRFGAEEREKPSTTAMFL